MARHAGHDIHLCKIVVGDLGDVENIKPLVNNPKYICRTCGRSANKSDNLCSPVDIKYSTDMKYSGT